MNRTRNSLEMNETIERGSWAVSRSERNTELSMNRPFVLDWPTRFSRTRTIQFMVPMRGRKTVEATHEPR